MTAPKTKLPIRAAITNLMALEFESNNPLFIWHDHDLQKRGVGIYEKRFYILHECPLKLWICPLLRPARGFLFRCFALCECLVERNDFGATNRERHLLMNRSRLNIEHTLRASGGLATRLLDDVGQRRAFVHEA